MALKLSCERGPAHSCEPQEILKTNPVPEVDEHITHGQRDRLLLLRGALQGKDLSRDWHQFRRGGLCEKMQNLKKER